MLGGGLAVWKLTSSGRRSASHSPAQEAEDEKWRVAAVDPAFDPTQPAGALEGMVKDVEGRPVDGAVVAIVGQRGRDRVPMDHDPGQPAPPREPTTAGALAGSAPAGAGVTARTTPPAAQ